MHDPNSIRSILPAQDARALIVGMSGTGKSTLAQAIMREIEKDSDVVITDPKNDWVGKQYTVITRPIELRFEWRYPILFRPDAKDFDDPEIYEPIFKIVWKRKNITIYNDEIMFMGTRPTPHLRAIMAQGRSKKIRAINGSQRPANIPLVTLTEANTFYAFYLSNQDDIRRIRQMVPEYDADALGPYEFWFKRIGQPARKLKLEQ